MPKPKFTPTDTERQLVTNLAAAGLPHDRIAAAVRDGINGKTLRKWFRSELDQGRDHVTATAVGQLARAIDRGEPWAVCFWLKCRARWRERQAIEHTGPDGEPDARSKLIARSLITEPPSEPMTEANSFSEHVMAVEAPVE